MSFTAHHRVGNAALCRVMVLFPCLLVAVWSKANGMVHLETDGSYDDHNYTYNTTVINLTETYLRCLVITVTTNHIPQHHLHHWSMGANVEFM